MIVGFMGEALNTVKDHQIGLIVLDGCKEIILTFVAVDISDVENIEHVLRKGLITPCHSME